MPDLSANWLNIMSQSYNAVFVSIRSDTLLQSISLFLGVWQEGCCNNLYSDTVSDFISFCCVCDGTFERI